VVDDTSDVAAAVVSLDDVIAMVRNDAAWVDKVMPTLPEEWQRYLISDEVIDASMEKFDLLDTDSSGTLAPAEVVPIIVALSEAKAWHIDETTCRRFIKVFDKDNDGHIKRFEFFSLMKFVIVVTYLKQQEDNEKGEAKLDTDKLDRANLYEAKMALNNVYRIEDVIEMVRSDRLGVDAEWIVKVIPLLPDDSREYLASPAFIEQAMTEFDSLDIDGSGALSTDELVPGIIKISQDQPWSITTAQCLEYAEVFDADQNGTVDRVEFYRFLQFLIVMAHFPTDEPEVEPLDEPETAHRRTNLKVNPVGADGQHRQRSPASPPNPLPSSTLRGEQPNQPESDEGPSGLIEFRYLSDHMENFCPERPMHCQYGCGTVTTARAADDHAKECDQRPVPCPRKKCGMLVVACGLERHVTYECPALLARRVPDDISMFDPQRELTVSTLAGGIWGVRVMTAPEPRRQDGAEILTINHPPVDESDWEEAKAIPVVFSSSHENQRAKTASAAIERSTYK
jgi:Ca2+-binding EF-hand superfamily protein